MSRSPPLPSRRLRLWRAGVVCWSLLLAGATTVLPGTSSASIVERVVAIVGERAILLSDLRERALPFLVRVYEGVPEGPQRTAAINQIYGVVLDRMIEEELEDTAATKMGLSVTSQEIDEALAKVAAQNRLSKNALLAEAKRSGLTVFAYREELRRQVLQSKIAGIRLQGRIRVTEADLRAAYRGYQLEERQKAPTRTLRLVLAAGKTPDEQSRQLARAEELVRRVRAGEEFRDLLDVEPALPGSGLSPSRAPEEEPDAIERAIVALEVGEIAPPVRQGDRLIVLQVIERAPSELPAFEDAVDQLNQRVYMEKLNKARSAWLDGLRKRTHIERKL